MHKFQRIVYASSAMHEDDFAQLFRDSKKIPGQQAQKYNRLMIKGFQKNGLEVCALSAPPITKVNCSKRIINLGRRQNGKVCWRYLPIVNMSGIKNAVVMCMAFLHAFFALIGRDAAVVCDVLNISVAMGAVFAGRLLGRKCVGIVTDVPELMVTGHTGIMVKYIYNIIGKCTDYVFLTEAMNERLNPNGKPYTIVEGICDEDSTMAPAYEKTEGQSCLYAGLLDAEYGVKHMVEAFCEADLPDCTLHICGSGPYAQELEKLAAQKANIVYHGVMLNKDVIQLEKKVSLLINPRPSTGEFTKFSFPSKNMEYMTSGTPVLAMRLPGIPDEYYDYIYTFSGETVSEMADSMKAVLSEPQETLEKKGHEAYRFVAEKKSTYVQAKKVAELITINHPAYLSGLKTIGGEKR